MSDKEPVSNKQLFGRIAILVGLLLVLLISAILIPRFFG